MGYDESLSGIEFRQGKGCHQCNGTGYRGRIGVYELLEMNPQMTDALRNDDQQAFAELARADESYRPLAWAALDDARKGITTLSEVFRLSAALSDEE